MVRPRKPNQLNPLAPPPLPQLPGLPPTRPIQFHPVTLGPQAPPQAPGAAARMMPPQLPPMPSGGMQNFNPQMPQMPTFGPPKGVQNSLGTRFASDIGYALAQDAMIQAGIDPTTLRKLGAGTSTTEQKAQAAIDLENAKRKLLGEPSAQEEYQQTQQAKKQAADEKAKAASDKAAKEAQTAYQDQRDNPYKYYAPDASGILDFATKNGLNVGPLDAQRIADSIQGETFSDPKNFWTNAVAPVFTASNQNNQRDAASRAQADQAYQNAMPGQQTVSPQAQSRSPSIQDVNALPPPPTSADYATRLSQMYPADAQGVDSWLRGMGVTLAPSDVAQMAQSGQGQTGPAYWNSVLAAYEPLKQANDAQMAGTNPSQAQPASTAALGQSVGLNWQGQPTPTPTPTSIQPFGGMGSSEIQDYTQGPTVDASALSADQAQQANADAQRLFGGPSASNGQSSGLLGGIENTATKAFNTAAGTVLPLVQQFQTDQGKQELQGAAARVANAYLSNPLTNPVSLLNVAPQTQGAYQAWQGINQNIQDNITTAMRRWAMQMALAHQQTYEHQTLTPLQQRALHSDNTGLFFNDPQATAYLDALWTTYAKDHPQDAAISDQILQQAPYAATGTIEDTPLAQGLLRRIGLGRATAEGAATAAEGAATAAEGAAREAATAAEAPRPETPPTEAPAEAAPTPATQPATPEPQVMTLVDPTTGAEMTDAQKTAYSQGKDSILRTYQRMRGATNPKDVTTYRGRLVSKIKSTFPGMTDEQINQAIDNNALDTTFQKMPEATAQTEAPSDGMDVFAEPATTAEAAPTAEQGTAETQATTGEEPPPEGGAQHELDFSGAMQGTGAAIGKGMTEADLTNALAKMNAARANHPEWTIDYVRQSPLGQQIVGYRKLLAEKYGIPENQIPGSEFGTEPPATPATPPSPEPQAPHGGAATPPAASNTFDEMFGAEPSPQAEPASTEAPAPTEAPAAQAEPAPQEQTAQPTPAEQNAPQEAPAAATPPAENAPQAVQLPWKSADDLLASGWHARKSGSEWNIFDQNGNKVMLLAGKNEPLSSEKAALQKYLSLISQDNEPARAAANTAIARSQALPTEASPAEKVRLADSYEKGNKNLVKERIAVQQQLRTGKIHTSKLRLTATRWAQKKAWIEREGDVWGYTVSDWQSLPDGSATATVTRKEPPPSETTPATTEAPAEPATPASRPTPVEMGPPPSRAIPGDARQPVPYAASNYGIQKLYHETDPETAVDIATAAMDKGGLNVTPYPELALGQGGKGALVEFADTSQIAVRPLKSKPGVQMMAAQGGPPSELEILTTTSSDGSNIVSSLTFEPGVKMRKSTVMRLRNGGWKEEKLPDGSVRFTNPKFATEAPAEPATPVPQATPAEAAPQAAPEATAAELPPAEQIPVKRIQWSETTYGPGVQDWEQNWLSKIATDRAGVLREAERRTGKRIIEVGNLSNSDLHSFLNGAANDQWFSRQVPPDVKTVIVGHGYGTGENWRLRGLDTTVQDYVNQHVPAGEKAWVVSCETGTSRNLSMLEGKIVESRGTAASASPAESAAAKTVTAEDIQQAKQLRAQGKLSIHDRYHEGNAPKEFKGIDRSGEERYGYAYSPEHFIISDASKQPIRYYVELPNGARVHPDELSRLHVDKDGKVSLAGESLTANGSGRVASFRSMDSALFDMTRYQKTDRNRLLTIQSKDSGMAITMSEADWRKAEGQFHFKKNVSFADVFDHLSANADKYPTLQMKAPEGEAMALPEGHSEGNVATTAEVAPTKQLSGPVGKTTTASGPDPNTTYEFQYRVVPMDELTVSHTDALERNPEYPAELQPRERDREASRRQIDYNAKTLNTSHLLHNGDVLDRNSPIVGSDTVVESGNGRLLSMRLARQEVPAKWQEYQTALRAALPELGIDPQSIEGIKDPVLVRERITPVENRAKFAEDANASSTLKMGTAENALQDARHLPDETIAQINVGKDQSLDQALQSAANKPIVQSFVQALPPNERAAVLDEEGNLNRTGLERLKAAIFAKTYHGEAGQRLTQAFFESLDPVIQSIKQGLFSNLPAMARAEGLMRSGARDAALSVVDDISKAVDVLARLKQEGMPVSSYLGQMSMFEKELTPDQERLLQFFSENGHSSKRIREFLDQFTTAIEKAPPPNQMSFLSESGPTKEDILGQAFQRQEASDAANSPLFNQGSIEHVPTRGEAFTGQAQTAAPETNGSQLAGGTQGLGETKLYSGLHPEVIKKGIGVLYKNKGKVALGALTAETLIQAAQRSNREGRTGPFSVTNPDSPVSSNPTLNAIANAGGFVVAPKDVAAALSTYNEDVANPFAEIVFEVLDIPGGGAARLMGANAATSKPGFFNFNTAAAFATQDPHNFHDWWSGLQQRYQDRQVRAPLPVLLLSMPLDPLNWLGWEEKPGAAAIEAALHPGEQAVGNGLTSLSKATLPDRAANDLGQKFHFLGTTNNAYADDVIDGINQRLANGTATTTDAQLADVLGSRKTVTHNAVKDLAKRMGNSDFEPTDEVVNAIAERVKNKHEWTPEDLQFLQKTFDTFGPTTAGQEASLADWFTRAKPNVTTDANGEVRVSQQAGQDLLRILGIANPPELNPNSLRQIAERMGKKNAFTENDVLWLRQRFGTAQQTRRNIPTSLLNEWAREYGLPDLSVAMRRSKGVSVGEYVPELMRQVRQKYPKERSLLYDWLDQFPAAKGVLVGFDNHIKPFTDFVNKQINVPLQLAFLTTLSWPLHASEELAVRGFHPSELAKPFLSTKRAVGAIRKGKSWREVLSHYNAFPDLDAHGDLFADYYLPDVMFGRGGLAHVPAEKNALSESFIGGGKVTKGIGNFIHDAARPLPETSLTRALMDGGANLISKMNLGTFFGAEQGWIHSMEKYRRLSVIAREHPKVLRQVIDTFSKDHQAAYDTLKNITKRPPGISDALWRRLQPVADLAAHKGNTTQVVESILQGRVDRKALATIAYLEGDLPLSTQAEFWATLAHATPEELKTFFTLGGNADKLLESGLQFEHGDRISELIQDVTSRADMQTAAGRRAAWKEIQTTLEGSMEIHRDLWDWAYGIRDALTTDQKDALFANVQETRQRLIAAQKSDELKAKALFYAQQAGKRGVKFPKTVMDGYSALYDRLIGTFREVDNQWADYWATVKTAGKHDPVALAKVRDAADAAWKDYRAYRLDAEERLNAQLENFFTRQRAAKAAGIADLAPEETETVEAKFATVPPEKRQAAQAALNRLRAQVDDFIRRPTITGPQADAARNWAKQVDAAAMALPDEVRNRIGEAQQAAARLVTQKINTHFVDYLNRTNLDDIMHNFVPFWMYDLHGGAHYKWLMTHVPGFTTSGYRYLDQTGGTGYVNTGNFQFNPMRALWPYRLVSFGRKMVTYQPKSVTDALLGAVNSLPDQGIVSAHLSPALELGIEGAQWAAGQRTPSQMDWIPAARMADEAKAWLGGGLTENNQYQQYQQDQQLAQMGIEPIHATTEQIRQAQQAMAPRQLGMEALPRFTYRTDLQLEKSRDFQSELAAMGISKASQDQWTKQGHSPWSLLNHQQQQQLLQKHPGWRYMMEASDAFATPEDQKNRLAVSNYMESLQKITQDRVSAQLKSDQAFTDGKITARQWMNDRDGRMQRALGAKDQAGSFYKDAQAVLDNPQRTALMQPEDVAVARYYARQQELIQANTDKSTGQINWANVDASLNQFARSLPQAQQQYLLQQIQKNQTPMEKDFHQAVADYAAYSQMPRWAPVIPTDLQQKRIQQEQVYYKAQQEDAVQAKIYYQTHALLKAKWPRNPQRDQFVLQHPDLRKFFPNTARGVKTNTAQGNYETLGEPVKAPWDTTPSSSTTP